MQDMHSTECAEFVLGRMCTAPSALNARSFGGSERAGMNSERQNVGGEMLNTEALSLAQEIQLLQLSGVREGMLVSYFCISSLSYLLLKASSLGTSHARYRRTSDFRW